MIGQEDKVDFEPPSKVLGLVEIPNTKYEMSNNNHRMVSAEIHNTEYMMIGVWGGKNTYDLALYF